MAALDVTGVALDCAATAVPFLPGGASSTISAGRNLIPFNGYNSTLHLLGTTRTPHGRTINFHAADRMVNPPRGRSPMSPSQVDNVLNNATNIRKRSYPAGNTLTLQNKNMQGNPQVVVDEATGSRIITVINPKIKK